VSNGWPIVPLGEALSHRKEFIQVDDLATYKRCRVQLHAQGVVLRDQVAGAEIKTKSQQVCRAGEFLVAEIDAKVGGYGIVPKALEEAIVSSHYFLFEINGSKLDRDFLGYFSKTPGFADQVAAQGNTNYAAIRPSHVLQYQIPLPPIAEQRRIVARIEELAAKIADARRLRQEAGTEVDLLVSQARAEVFGDLLREGSIPLADAVTLERGKFTHRPRNEPRFFGGQHPWIQIGEIESANKKLSQNASRY